MRRGETYVKANAWTAGQLTCRTTDNRLRQQVLTQRMQAAPAPDHGRLLVGSPTPRFSASAPTTMGTQTRASPSLQERLNGSWAHL